MVPGFIKVHEEMMKHTLILDRHVKYPERLQYLKSYFIYDIPGHIQANKLSMQFTDKYKPPATFYRYTYSVNIKKYVNVYSILYPSLSCQLSTSYSILQVVVI